MKTSKSATEKNHTQRNWSVLTTQFQESMQIRQIHADTLASVLGGSDGHRKFYIISMRNIWKIRFANVFPDTETLFVPT